MIAEDSIDLCERTSSSGVIDTRNTEYSTSQRPAVEEALPCDIREKSKVRSAVEDKLGCRNVVDVREVGKDCTLLSADHALPHFHARETLLPPNRQQRRIRLNEIDIEPMRIMEF